MIEKQPSENKAWFLVADATHGRLLNSGVAGVQRCHVEEVDRIENTWEGHEQGRPSMLAARGTPSSYASRGHEVEEEQQRFAREVAGWLEGQIQRRGIDGVMIFAGPPFLGALRRACGANLGQRCEVKNANLAGLSAAELAGHPLILELTGLGGQ